MLRPLFLQYQAVFSVIQRPIPGPPVMQAVFEALRVCAHADGHGLFLPADAARNFKAFFAPPNGAVQPTFPVSRYSRQTFSKKSSSFGMGRTGRHSNTHAPSRYSISCTRPPRASVIQHKGKGVRQLCIRLLCPQASVYRALPRLFPPCCI